MKKTFVLFFLLGANVLFSNDLYNPFSPSPYQNSLLDYNRFYFSNQLSFISMINNKGSQSRGIYLSTLGYGLSDHVWTYAHIGKQYDFSSNDGPEDPNDFIKGATLLYQIDQGFLIGAEYGVTPCRIQHDPFMETDLFHVWAEKEIGKNFKMFFQYYQKK
ncbi:MAG: hypothetical protein JW827_06745 [Spirochaetes bacterium]|nr:hypothetical protein [Spirochaetota bacterium]